MYKDMSSLKSENAIMTKSGYSALGYRGGGVFEENSLYIIKFITARTNVI